MKKGLVPHQCWFDAIEEEKKVKRNLSRLIHTFRHIPPDRTEPEHSLRNLVKEIECFNHPVPKETRHFNRNICNTLSDDKALSFPNRIKGERKLQIDDSNKEVAILSTSSKSKNSKKSNLCINKNKPKHDFNYLSTEISPDRKQYSLKNKTTLKNKLQKDSSNKQKRQDLSSKFDTREEMKIAVNNRQLNKNPNASKHTKLEVLDKVKTSVRRSTIGQKQLMYSKGLQKIDNKNNKPLTTQESNVVKNLTNYWNSVLNNDVDEFKSEISSPRSLIASVKSLYKLSQELQSTESTPNIKSRNVSEIDLSDKHNSNCMLNTLEQEIVLVSNQTERFNQRTGHNYKQYSIRLSNSTTSTCSKSNSSDVEQDFGPESTCPKGISETRRSEIEFVIDTNQALVTLEKLQWYIKLFPNASLLSDEICLPRSVKVMISLLTAALSSDQYKQLWIDVSECEIVHNQLTSDGESKLILSSLSSQQGGSGDFSMTAGAIVIPNKSVVQVNNALKYISLCKEVLWTMYIYNSISCLNPQTGRFSFVYEETIMIEETDSEDGESDEEEDEEVSIKDLIIVTANTLREMTNSFLQRVGDSLPNSMESIMRTIYYTIASALVWWVIVKEIWYAK